MPVGRAKARVLVVDDEPAYVELMLDLVGSFGYGASGAVSSAEALKKASAERPDLILLDIVMPGTDGIETLRLLKGDPATCNIPVLMISSKRGGEDIEAAFEKGAVGYVIKPAQPLILQQRLEEILGPGAKGRA
jgi:CheY-like chemotaxis protein